MMLNKENQMKNLEKKEKETLNLMKKKNKSKEKDNKLKKKDYNQLKVENPTKPLLNNLFLL